MDAIAVHAFNGTWGVIAVGFFAADNLVRQSYGYHPYKTNALTGASDVPRHYGCFMGGDGRLLAAQIVYAIWLGGAPPMGFVVSRACCVWDHLLVWLACLLKRALMLHSGCLENAVVIADLFTL